MSRCYNAEHQGNRHMTNFSNSFKLIRNGLFYPSKIFCQFWLGKFWHWLTKRFRWSLVIGHQSSVILDFWPNIWNIQTLNILRQQKYFSSSLSKTFNDSRSEKPYCIMSYQSKANVLGLKFSINNVDNVHILAETLSPPLRVGWATLKLGSSDVHRHPLGKLHRLPVDWEDFLECKMCLSELSNLG